MGSLLLVIYVPVPSKATRFQKSIDKSFSQACSHLQLKKWKTEKIFFEFSSLLSKYTETSGKHFNNICQV